MKWFLICLLSLFFLGNSCDNKRSSPYDPDNLDFSRQLQMAYRKQCQSGSLDVYRTATSHTLHQIYNNLYGLQQGEAVTISGIAHSQCNFSLIKFHCSGQITSSSTAFTQINCSKGTIETGYQTSNYQTTQTGPRDPYRNQSLSFQQGVFRITPGNNQFFVNITLNSPYAPCLLIFSCQ